MSTTRTIDETDIICGLKGAITELECLQQAEILKEQKEKVMSPIVYITIPIQHVTDTKKQKSRSKSKSDIRASSKDKKRASSKDKKCSPSKDKKRSSSKDKKDPAAESQCKDKDKDKVELRKKLSRVIFPEMRGGVLYSRCCCLHRDGLQDSCPLTQCQGQPDCLVKPWAVCPPGKYVRSRYPELYPTKSKTELYQTKPKKDCTS